MLPQAPLFVQLGSGLVAPQAWINIDASWNARISKIAPSSTRVRRLLARVAGDTLLVEWPKNILVRDVRKGIRFADGSVTAIYASHLIEHLKPEAASRLLRECHRALQVGGVLRLLTPDVEQLARKYLAAKDNKPSEAGATAADEFVASLGVLDQKPDRTLLRWYRKLTGYHTHKWLYDGDSLRSLVEDAGFIAVKRLNFLDSRIPLERLREVELRHRFEDSVCIEGCK